MAQRTISDAGGDWTSTSTWVEGVVPGTSDYVVATATSGDLTISSGSKRILYIDLTLYTGTLSITAANSRIEVTQSGGTSIFNAGAYVHGDLDGSLSGFFKIYQFSGTHTIIQVPGSPEIPYLSLQSNTPIIFLGSDIYCKVSQICESTANEVGFDYKFYISHKFINSLNAKAYDGRNYADVVMIGESCSITSLISEYNIINNSLTIDTSGTCSVSGFVLIQTAPESVNKHLKVLNGFVDGVFPIGDVSNLGDWLSLEGISSNLLITNESLTINLLNECSPNISFSPYSISLQGLKAPSSSSTLLNIIGGTFSGSLDISTSSPAYSIGYVVPSVSLDPAYTHSISKINGIGVLTDKPTLKSTVPDTQVNINLGSNTDSILANVNLTDINVTGSTPLYAYQSTLDNTTGVTLVEPGGGGGGGESAYTYVN